MEEIKEPLISVIVPVYQTEKYLRRCLDSILSQTYRNIELIIVNDGSKDNSEDIIMEYLRKYNNIKYIRHKKNKGLFRARISGAEEAAGEYIAFVDSDDYISVDFYRLLVRKALETGADMVVGNFTLKYESGWEEYQNLDPFHIREVDLSGEQVLRAYMEQEGRCYTYQLVWNKLYKRYLWDDALNEFRQFSNEHPRLVMCEDMAFSSYMWAHAKKVCSSLNAVYYYYKHADAASANNSGKAIIRNCADIPPVFDFFRKMLVQVGKYERYKTNFDSWKKCYGRMYYSLFLSRGLLDDNWKLLKDGFFGDGKMCGQTYEDNYFYSILTEVTEVFSWYEDIKRKIADPGCKYVSFDIFDTLILRPFWQPSDLFYLMNDYFMELTGAVAYIEFAQIRIESERLCRKEIGLLHPGFEDITLDEIYDTMQRHYFFSQDVCDKLKRKERELEIRFCRARKSGKELYQLALDMHKTVFFTSDMYLDSATIKEILSTNGYTEYSELFLSSELRIGKWSGNLYKYILRKYEADDPASFVHIGDNWDSDVQMPKKHGLFAYQLCKPIDMFQNGNPGIYTGEAFSQSFFKNATGRDMSHAFSGFPGLRTILAVVANKIFDNPYVVFNKDTDFNANPFYIGYYALGMHLYAVTSWLLKNVNGKKIKKIHFVARDGYLVKRAYDILTESKRGDFPDSNYLYLSRKALLFANISYPADMYSLYYSVNTTNLSPLKFMSYFRGILADNKINEIIERLQKNGFPKSKYFSCREEWDSFLHFFLENIWNEIDWKPYRNMIHDYFKDLIDPGDVLFDIGYSGRSESALKNILGFAPDSYYIHSNSETLNRRMDKDDFNTETFYPYKPFMTGVMREHMFMKLSPSTTGYEYRGKEIVPVFEDYKVDPATKYVTETVQNAALEFISDLKDIFGEYLSSLYVRSEDLSQPFEYYLHYAKKLDRNVFSTVVFEDDLGEGKAFRAVDFWSSEVKRMFSEQKNIEQKNRVIDESEYIGTTKPIYFSEESANSVKDKHSEDFSRTAIFLDKVSQSDTRDDKFSKAAGNVGNLLEWDSILHLLNPAVIPSWYSTKPGGFDESEYDIYISTHLTWIEENADLTYLYDVLERIGDKILLPISIGFSTADSHKNFSLSGESVKALHAVAERCKTVGVKGAYSASVLEHFGIKNFDVIGTPSVYRNIGQMRSIRKHGDARNTVCSFKPFYGEFSEQEKTLLSYMAAHQTKLIDTTPLTLSKENLCDDMLYTQIKKWETKKSIYFDLDEWSAALSDADFALGMNFANNILAMQSSIPALFINYESVGRELCEYYALPSVEISEFDTQKSLSDYLNMVDLSKFANLISKRFRDFSDFLKKNRIEFFGFADRTIDK